MRHLQSLVSRYGSTINTTKWSVPVYTVGPAQPTVRVFLDQPVGVHQALRNALAQVPIPRGARPSPDSDAHMVIWQPSTGSMWEFWRARWATNGWHTVFGGRMTSVSTNPGYFPKPPGWGAAATGLPLLAGLIRINELRAGFIPHALSMAVPATRANLFALPAQRTDGTSLDPAALPEGTRLRINPFVHLSKIPMAPVVRIVARAAQQYGIFVTDRGGAVALYAEDPYPTGTNPYPAFFGGGYPSVLMQQFPWSRLQVVDAPLLSRR